MSFVRLMGWLLAAAPTALFAAEIEFNRDIRPILSENCFACHGSDVKQRKGDLRLDQAEAALADRDGSYAIKPGDTSASEVWKRIASDDPDEIMPPPASHKKLSAEQKATIRRWIEQGAVYQKHWAFEPPVKAAEPKVGDAGWTRNAVDRFILARLEAEGLRPQPEADKHTLIRRVALALTGLPPTVKEVDDYLADDSSGSYEAMVDRYLASPRYGEEMARHWLDVARYADTHGLHLDNERQMWAYRDWVIKAFNDNLDYEDFTIWQLAGDLLPKPTPDQLTATGFNRCNVTTSEGGAIPEEYLYRYAVDRASTTIQTWLGLTGGCAVCHDHKYDPLTTKEFYSFYAFFNSAADPGLDKNINKTDPFFKLPELGQQAALDAAMARENSARKHLEATAAKADYTDPAAEPARSKDAADEKVADEEVADEDADAKPLPMKRQIADILLDDCFAIGSTLKNTSRNESQWVADPPFGAPSGRRVLHQANAYFHEDIVENDLRPVTIPSEARFEIWLRLDPLNVPKGASVVLTAGGTARRVWWGAGKMPDGIFVGSAKSKRMGKLPPPGQWTKLTFKPKDFDLKPGQRVTKIALQVGGGAIWWDAFTLVGASEPDSDPLESFIIWWKGMKAKQPPDVPADLIGVLKAGPKVDVDPQLAEKLKRFYLAYIARPVDDQVAARRRDWEEARAAHAAADDAIAGTMIYHDLDTPRDSFVMIRGQYDKPGDKVEPGVPAVFAPLTKAKPDALATRLDLARWLVSPEHPLAARVQVNRLWQQFFGIGLVKTSYDFGSQGEMPSHPELLDWLAVRFRESGWDTKQMVRLLVTSATFRQSSRSTAELRRRDPENRLLARGPRFRLDAEQIRDNSLFVSGLLNLDVGGRGVNSYQPPDIWEPVGYNNSNTRYYLQDHGSAIYRRSIYAFLKRTAPPPFMSNFDAPNREQFCTRRERSNTPLQALQLMNDTQQFEAARALAERAISEADDTPEARITFLYRAVLSRQPDDKELKVVRRAFNAQRKLFQTEPDAAKAAVHVGESVPRALAPDAETAAWTLTANLILNLDETINRN